MESGQRSIHTYLIKRSQAGDREAQSELYKQYVKAMYNVCRRMMGNDEDAKDVLQEAFIHALTKITTLRDPLLFSSWLKRIMINHCLNAIKKRDHKPLFSEELSFDSEQSEASTHEPNYQVKQVLQAMDQISPGRRMVLSLYLFEGYDHEEIAQILGISKSASKSQYSKAKSRIRELVSHKSVTP